jgi:hypothetical protein
MRQSLVDHEGRRCGADVEPSTSGCFNRRFDLVCCWPRKPTQTPRARSRTRSQPLPLRYLAGSHRPAYQFELGSAIHAPTDHTERVGQLAAAEFAHEVGSVTGG